MQSTRDELVELWRRVLVDGTDHDNPEEAVVAELAEYFGMPVETVRMRCRNSKDFSREEWFDQSRGTPDELIEFWNRISPVFGITMSHAKQYTGEHPTTCIDIAERLATVPRARMLDFGCGPATSAMFFRRLGWEVTAADVSTTMVEFARWRMRRRQIDVDVVNSLETPLPTGVFDVLIALEVLAHVPDVSAALTQMRQLLKPNGLLIFNVYAPPRSADTFGHLFVGNWHVIRHVRSIGFRKQPRLGNYYVYERFDRNRTMRTVIGAIDIARHNALVSATAQQVRAVKARLSGRLTR